MGGGKKKSVKKTFEASVCLALNETRKSCWSRGTSRRWEGVPREERSGSPKHADCFLDSLNLQRQGVKQTVTKCLCQNLLLNFQAGEVLGRVMGGNQRNYEIDRIKFSVIT